MSVKLLNNAQEHKAIITPSTNPSLGNFLSYFKADGKLYRKDSAGVEVEVNAGAATGNITITLTNREGSVMVPGDVVVIDTVDDSSCVLGSSNSDTKVVGVISTGGNDGDPVEVCTSGTIDTKVNGSISRGDSLATSGAATGRARGAAGAVNAVLGKALEANVAGDGTIKVIVNLA